MPSIFGIAKLHNKLTVVHNTIWFQLSKRN